MKFIALVICTIGVGHCSDVIKHETYTLNAFGTAPGLCAKVDKFNTTAHAAEFFAKAVQMVLNIVQGSGSTNVSGEFARTRSCAEDRFEVTLLVEFKVASFRLTDRWIVESAAAHLGRWFDVELAMIAVPKSIKRKREPTRNRKVAPSPFTLGEGVTFQSQSCVGGKWAFVDASGTWRTHRASFGSSDLDLVLRVEDSGTFLCWRDNEILFEYVINVVPSSRTSKNVISKGSMLSVYDKNPMKGPKSGSFGQGRSSQREQSKDEDGVLRMLPMFRDSRAKMVVKDVIVRPDQSSCRNPGKKTLMKESTRVRVQEGGRLVLPAYYHLWTRTTPAGQVLISPKAYLSRSFDLTIDVVTLGDGGTYRSYNRGCFAYFEFEVVVAPKES